MNNRPSVSETVRKKGGKMQIIIMDYTYTTLYFIELYSLQTTFAYIKKLLDNRNAQFSLKRVTSHFHCTNRMLK